MFIVHQNSIGSAKFKSIESALKHIKDSIEEDWSLCDRNETDDDDDNDYDDEVEYILEFKVVAKKND
jgi:hypothetical protein